MVRKRKKPPVNPEQMEAELEQTDIEIQKAMDEIAVLSERVDALVAKVKERRLRLQNRRKEV